MNDIVEVSKFERNTKASTWHKMSEEREELSWRLIIEANGFFRALGGRETTRGRTHTSVSPSGLEKIVYRLIA